MRTQTRRSGYAHRKRAVSSQPTKPSQGEEDRSGALFYAILGTGFTFIESLILLLFIGRGVGLPHLLADATQWVIASLTLLPILAVVGLILFLHSSKR